jgi:hypothetical protein
MSLANYGDLISAITAWSGRSDINADVVGLFEGWANRRLRVRAMEAVTTLAPSSGSVALPSDFLAIKMVRWPGNATTGTDLRVLEYVHPAWFNAAYPSTPSDTPRVFTIEGSTLYVMPVDDSTLTVLYYQRIPALATNTTNWLMTAHPDLYLSGSLHEAYAFMLDAEKAILWKAKRDEMAEEIEDLNDDVATPLAIRIMGTVL